MTRTRLEVFEETGGGKRNIGRSIYRIDLPMRMSLKRTHGNIELTATQDERGKNAHAKAVLDLQVVGDETYVHPLKVDGRSSATMFFPHLIAGERAIPVTSSAASARLAATRGRMRRRPDHWTRLVDDAVHFRLIEQHPGEILISGSLGAQFVVWEYATAIGSYANCVAHWNPAPRTPPRG